MSEWYDKFTPAEIDKAIGKLQHDFEQENMLGYSVDDETIRHLIYNVLPAYSKQVSRYLRIKWW